jgi:hypothetical protein
MRIRGANRKHLQTQYIEEKFVDVDYLDDEDDTYNDDDEQDPDSIDEVV